MDIQKNDGVFGAQPGQDTPVDADDFAGLLFKGQVGGVIWLVLVDSDFDEGRVVSCRGFAGRILDPDERICLLATRMR